MSRELRIMHAALSLSAILIPAACGILRGTGAARALSAGPTLLPVTLGVTLGFGIAALVIRARILPRSPAESPDRWWLAQLPKAVAVWATAEGMSLAASLAYYFTGRALGLAGVVLGLGILYATRPARLEEA